MAEYLGLGDRLAAGPSGSMAGAAFGDELRSAKYLWAGMSHADLAHAIALHDAGVLDDATAAELLRALIELDATPVGDVELDPHVGDVYNNRDRLLKQMAPNAAGHLHAGRARREASTIGWLLHCRHALIGLGLDVARLVGVLAETSADHRASLMPDFTYLHRAHPTTLGHYLLTHAWPAARHLDRIGERLELVTRSSPAGSGSVNGTRIPIDRKLLADLLGFDGLMLHTRDAMWAPDLALDLAGMCVQIMTTVDRIAEELQLWSTEAFGFVTLADEHCRTSVVMPHKKNPYSLTHLRGAARRTTGAYVGVASSMQTASGQPDNRTIAYHDVPFMLDISTESVRLLADVVDAAVFDVKRLAAAADDPMMASTEWCDLLTLEHGFDNRTAHRIVGRAVRTVLDGGRNDLGPVDLSTAAAGLGFDMEVDATRFAHTANPRSVVDGRRTPGGAGPQSVDAMCEELRARSKYAHDRFTTHPGSDYVAQLLARAERLTSR